MYLRIFRAINIFLLVNASLYWLINVSCLFFILLLITIGVHIIVQCALIKVGWLSACIAIDWRCICHIPPALAYNLHRHPANGRKGKKLPVPEFIDPVFTKISPKRSLSVIKNERVGLVFAKTGSIILGTEEMSQTLLIKKKQGNLDYAHAANIIKPT
jgi:hypothetical protein